MRFTRRNTIIGLGTLAAGAGVIGGSGAFDQVQAERDFTVGVADDSAALLKLEANGGSEIATTSGSGTANNNSVLDIDLDGELNDRAITIFEDAFTITNNGDEAVNVSVNPTSGGSDVSDPGLAFSVGSPPTTSESNNPSTNDSLTDPDSVQLDPGEGIGVSITVDTGASDGLSGTYQESNVDAVLITASSGDATTS